VSDVAHRPHIDQGAGQERADGVDVDGEAALDLAVDHALDHFLGGKRCLELFPYLGALGLLARELGLAEAVLDGFQRHLHLVADAQGALTGGVDKLGAGDDPLGLEPRVYGDPLVVDIDNNAGHDGAGLHVNGLEAFLKKFGERFAHSIVTCSVCPDARGPEGRVTPGACRPSSRSGSCCW
jgi:hypothetical protein